MTFKSQARKKEIHGIMVYLLQKFGTLPKATLYANKKSHILLLSTPTMKRPLRTSDKVRIF